MKEYFGKLDEEVKRSYDIASEARKKGLDPSGDVEVMLASKMAERVKGIVSTVSPQIGESKIVERIDELEKQYGAQDWRVAFILSLEVAQEKLCKFKDKREAAEVGLRVGLAYLTNGVLSAPLERFVQLKLRKRKKDGKEYCALYFSGPIRSAGTTAVCVFAAVADYVRKELGYAEYDPTEEEVNRIVSELYDFHDRITNLQYLPTEEEITFMVSNLPIQIDGDPSETMEVSNFKDLDRIDTNRLRNGVCLVVGEGLCQKAAKFYSKFSNMMKDFGMERWKFLGDYIALQKKLRAKDVSKDDVKIKPDFNFMKDVVAGRPIFTHPMAKGGFRLRYGRSRVSGFSAQAIHPATMCILDGFLASGSQLKVERPGKACVLGSCDTIEGPIVKLKDGSVVFAETEEQAKKVNDYVEEILYLGDLLINYGDFLNRGHVLVPAGYCEEWWQQEAEHPEKNIDVDTAIELCKKGKPLHPRYTFHWNDITREQFFSVIDLLKKSAIKDDKIVLPLDYNIKDDVENKDPKRALEILGVPHRVVINEHMIIEGDWAKALLFTLGDFNFEPNDNVLEMLNKKNSFLIRDKSGTFIGARMGRPEKAKMRKLKGSPQALFPVGAQGGRMRDFRSALEKGFVKSDFNLRKCEKCNQETVYKLCETCANETKQLYYCDECKIVKDKKCHERSFTYSNQKLDIHKYFNKALEIIGTREYPELIKGVKGTMNEDHTPENLVKGILRAMNGLYVNKDGTIRYDMTETPITHFKPKEIGTSVAKLKELGYEKDCYGVDLVSEEQICELKVQDLILPACPDSLEEGADEVLFRIGKFVDDLMEKFYKLPRFYNFKTKKDIVGSLVLGLSPHTSAGIVGRVIGFSKTQGFLAHPTYHSIMRRDCDGDEACIILLMDALINFSRGFLPAHRGGKQDEPLVLTTKIIPKEVDDMVFDMDICWKYPLQLYNAALEYKSPKEVKIEKLGMFLGTPREYEGYGFTHDTSDFNNGVKCSTYKSIPTMLEKVQKQMRVAEKLRAVDEVDVAGLIIDRHFMRDIKGNLRKFSQQEFRCVECNEKYRRPPLQGNCIKCGGKLLFTVSEGNILKYLEPSLMLAEKYDLAPYLKQNLKITKARIESIFGKDETKQEALKKWF